ncbi:AAA family ATPase [Candidatus Woesearchaeota archaeon]|nr:AAA family ATPase [Candidatus Woesearchaeota archaeon]
MISTGNKELDSFLDGYGNDINVIYGPAASGKTTLAIIATIGQLKKDKKVVFLDTENGFSIDRFMQICGISYLNYLDRLLLIRINNFEEQCKKTDSLINLVGIDLVIVDSLGIFYRKEVKEDHLEINRKMDRQLRVLTEITRKGVPVIITNQVSTDAETGEIKMVGGDMVKTWAKKLIELKKEPRKIILKKPEEKEIKFEIVNEGIKLFL